MQKPAKYVMLELLAPIAYKWELIGISLEVRHSVLMSLAQSNYSDLMRLAMVIQSWMDTQSTPVTWETVIFAVESPIVNNMSVATKLRNYLTHLNPSNSLTDIEKPGKGINYIYVCSCTVW